MLLQPKKKEVKKKVKRNMKIIAYAWYIIPETKTFVTTVGIL